MANNKDFEKDFKLPDTKALSEAYTEYLDSVTFGGKPIGCLLYTSDAADD